MFPDKSTPPSHAEFNNPIYFARTSEQLSQASLAKRLGLARPFIIRVEQGCYKTPGDILTDYASQVLELSPKQIIGDYKAFQQAVRINTLRTKVTVEPITGPVPAQDQNKNFSSERVATRIFSHDVFRDWREETWPTLTAFCIDMCVHPSSVNKYENGSMLHMPEQLVSVLQETGLIGNIEYTTRWYYV